MTPTDPVERDADLAWEIYGAQPTNPEAARLAHRVLAAQPARSGMTLLLSYHHEARGELDRARDLARQVLGRADRFEHDAARQLRDVEAAAGEVDEALRWALEAARHDPQSWQDRIELGRARTAAGDREVGWDTVAAGVSMCARTDASALPEALTVRAQHLLSSFGPVDRFLAAAEEALRANPGDPGLGVPLAYAYLHEYRFEDAREHLRGMLRTDPTHEAAQYVLGVVETILTSLETSTVTVESHRRSRSMEMLWVLMRAETTDTSLPLALAALDEVLPADLRAALRPAADREAARESAGEWKIAAWHDGQEPGGDLWRVGAPFRLMSMAEIAAMDALIEAEPDQFPHWDDDLYYIQVLTDDADSYLLEGPGGAMIRWHRLEEPTEIAPSLADWFWDRVAAFGGKDPRPRR